MSEFPPIPQISEFPPIPQSHVRDLPKNFVKTWHKEVDDREDMVEIIYTFLTKNDNIIVTLLMSNKPDSIPDYYNWASIIELIMYMHGSDKLYTEIHNGIPNTLWENKLKDFINNFKTLVVGTQAATQAATRLRL